MVIFHSYVKLPEGNLNSSAMAGDDSPQSKKMIPGFGRTGFGPDEIYPDISYIIHGFTIIKHY